MFDVLTFDPTASNPMAAMAHYQQEDLIALGKIILGKAKILISYHSDQSIYYKQLCLQFIAKIFDYIPSIGLQ